MDVLYYKNLTVQVCIKITTFDERIAWLLCILFYT